MFSSFVRKFQSSIAQLLFLWADPILFRGWRRPLERIDLATLLPNDASSEKLFQNFQRLWIKARSQNTQRPSLWVVLLKMMSWRLVLQAVLQIIDKCLLIGQSVVLGYLANYFMIANPTDQNTTDAYLFATALVVMGIAMVVVYAHGSLVAQKTGMMARIICTAAVYERIVYNRGSGITTGHVINIVSNDVQRLDSAFLFLHYLWIGPLYIIVYTYLVYQEIGPAVFLATGFVLTQIPLQMILAKLFATLRLKSALLTDKRVKAMKELISGIRVIKMYAWEQAFIKIVHQLRRMESVTIRNSSMIRAGNYALFTVSLTVMAFLMFSTYAGLGGTLTPKVIFTILSLTGALRVTSIHFFVLGILNLSETVVAIQRIEKVLDTSEPSANVDSCIILSNHAASSSSLVPLIAHSSSNCIAEPIPKPTTGNILETIPKCSLEPAPEHSTESIPECINPGHILGPIPEHILGPIPEHILGPTPEHILGNGPIPEHNTACSQQPSYSIRCEHVTLSWENGGENKALIDICFQINTDVHLLGVVGPVGAGKSTLLHGLLGELKPLEGTLEVKGKISYASQDPWVFSGTVRENILFGSPYDKDWYNTVIEACGLKKDIARFPNGDLTFVGDQGVSLSGGQRSRVNLARAVYYTADTYLLDDPLSAVDAAMARHIFDKCICGLLKHKTVILAINQFQFFDKLDWILTLNSGKIISLSTPEELHNKGIEYCMLLGAKDGVFLDEEEEGEEEGGDSIKTDREPITFLPMNSVVSNHKNKAKGRRPSVFSTLSIYSNNSAASGRQLPTLRDSETTEDGISHVRSVGIKTYVRYILAGARPPLLLLVVAVFFIAEGSIVAGDLWLSDWQSDCISDNSTGNTSLQCTLTVHQKIAIYGGITAAVIIFNVARIMMVFQVAINASRVFHNRALRSLLRAPTVFFDINTLGSILNLFSKDVGNLDDTFPFMLCDYLMLLLRCLAILIVTASSEPWIFLPIVPFVIVILFLRTYYLRSARNIRTLEADARSPLYSHVSTTMQGLPTIRTFGQQPTALDTFHVHQDCHSQAWYLCLATTRWFGMRIDTLNTVFLAAVAYISVSLASSTSGGLVGLGLTYTITLIGMLQYCVRLSGEVESMMVSAERVMECSMLEPEAPLETTPPYTKPPPNWPQRGEVVFEEVSLRYSDYTALVLKSISLTIKAGEKIGIVGRTGAGKSSLIHALFRMAEPVGNIMIDGVDTRSIGLHDLRKHISIIPQNPFIFSSTVRNNLDPFCEFDDVTLWNVLERVQLRSTVENMEGGLEGQVSEGGSNFSVGQRQLICLARALLRKNKILVLDEATANIDVRTDNIIQRIIHDACAECTVLVVAHRLNTVMDSDRILVLNQGRVKEFGEPYALLQSPDSLLRRITKQTGSSSASKLNTMAHRHHHKLQEAFKEESCEASCEAGASNGDSALLAEYVVTFT